LRTRAPIKVLAIEQALVYIPLVILVSTAIIFFIAHWMPNGIYDE
jgi:flagellar biosynthesis protein FliQ